MVAMEPCKAVMVVMNRGLQVQPAIVHGDAF